jgi:hypothetical protein
VFLCSAYGKTVFFFEGGFLSYSSRKMDMLYKAGTVQEIAQIKKSALVLPEEVYGEVLRIVTILDEVYGADRDVDNGDGGFVLIAENVQDLSLISQRYMKLDNATYEAVELVKCSNQPYLNVLYLSNNEFGINIFMPVSIAPRLLLEELKRVRNTK